MDRTDFLPYLAIWAIVCFILVVRSLTARGVGLVVSNCVMLAAQYASGGIIHALPWSELPDSNLTFSGFRESTFALLGFAAGVLLLSRTMPERPPVKAMTDERLPRFYIIGGIFAQLILVPTVGRLPSLSAISVLGAQMVVVGLCLGAWKAWLRRGLRGALGWILPGLPLPIVTAAHQGFMGTGAIALAVLFVFLAHFLRPRWLIFATCFALIYPGLTLYCAYMRDRTELRGYISEGRSIGDRFELMGDMLNKLEPFDPFNQEHLYLIDMRINQAGLMGSCVEYLANNDDAYLRGESIKNAAISMVPRVLWPGKPPTGGGLGLATKLTGIEYSSNTSVAVPTLMELYGNFGRYGMMFGMAVIGAICAFVDRVAGYRLRSGDWVGFTRFYVFGASIQIGFTLMELTGTAAAALVFGTIITNIFQRYQRFIEHLHHHDGAHPELAAGKLP